MCKEINDEFWTSISIEDWDISLNLINDTKSSALITIGNVYVDNKPVPYFQEFTLDRRDKMQVDFGPILRDYIYIEELVAIGKLD